MKRGVVRHKDDPPRPLPEDVWLKPLELTPIDWTKEAEQMFALGMVKVETMSRAEFNRRYPDTLPKDK